MKGTKQAVFNGRVKNPERPPLSPIAQSPVFTNCSPWDKEVVPADVKRIPSQEFLFAKQLHLPGSVEVREDIQDSDFQRWLECSRESSRIATQSAPTSPLGGTLELRSGALSERGVALDHSCTSLRRLSDLKRFPLDPPNRTLSLGAAGQAPQRVNRGKSLLQLDPLPPMTRVAPEPGGPSDMLPGGPGDFNDEQASGHLASGSSSKLVQFLNSSTERGRESTSESTLRTLTKARYEDTASTNPMTAPHH